jgi:hypothetical protein
MSVVFKRFIFTFEKYITGMQPPTVSVSIMLISLYFFPLIHIENIILSLTTDFRLTCKQPFPPLKIIVQLPSDFINSVYVFLSFIYLFIFLIKLDTLYNKYRYYHITGLCFCPCKLYLSSSKKRCSHWAPCVPVRIQILKSPFMFYKG